MKEEERKQGTKSGTGVALEREKRKEGHHPLPHYNGQDETFVCPPGAESF